MIVVPAAAFSASAAGVRQAVESRLSRVGLQVDSIRRLGPPPFHWLVQLPGATDSKTAATARADLAADAEFDAVLPAYRTADANLPLFVLNRIVARFKSGVSPNQVIDLAKSLGAVVVRAPVPDSGYVTYLIEPVPGSKGDVLKIANAIDESPIALWGSPDMIDPNTRPMSVPTDAFYPQQYYLNSSVMLNGIPVDINIEPAWDLTKGSSSIRVIFIDTGVDRWHPEWAARGGTMIGFDALWYLPQQPGEWAGQPFAGDTIDQHGTAAAGIVLASHDGLGTAGIAPNVLFDAVRIFHDTLHVATDNDIANGITWAAAHGDVLNNSWGGCGSPSQTIRDAVLNAMSTGRSGKGAVVVFSAGNYNPSIGCNTLQTWQSQIPGVISVAALAKTGAKASYSLTGPAISVSAFGGEAKLYPTCFGADIVTTVLSYNQVPCDGPSGSYKYTSTFSGTSAAAPQVSGVAALLLSREPNLTAAQVKARIVGNAVPWGSSTIFGAGKLDAFATLSPFTVSIAGPGFVTTSGNYTWTANASGGTSGYSYHWDASYDGQNYYDTGVGTQSYSRFVDTDDHFWLRATVTSGSRQKAAVKEVLGICASSSAIAGAGAALIPPC